MGIFCDFRKKRNVKNLEEFNDFDFKAPGWRFKKLYIASAVTWWKTNKNRMAVAASSSGEGRRWRFEKLRKFFMGVCIYIEGGAKRVGHGLVEYRPGFGKREPLI